MSAKWGRKSVILFYASVRGLLTLKRRKSMAYIQTANRTIERSPNVVLIIEINRLVKRAFDVAGRELVALWRQQWGREHTLKMHGESDHRTVA